jgi:hypothetical protein
MHEACAKRRRRRKTRLHTDAQTGKGFDRGGTERNAMREEGRR